MHGHIPISVLKISTFIEGFFTFNIACEHLAQCGARNCSKSRSQYNFPFSSTKPHSTKLTEQFEHVK